MHVACALTMYVVSMNVPSVKYRTREVPQRILQTKRHASRPWGFCRGRRRDGRYGCAAAWWMIFWVESSRGVYDQGSHEKVAARGGATLSTGGRPGGMPRPNSIYSAT